MNKVVLLSWHYYNSKRQAGFHFLANAFRDKGFQVVFISSAISLLNFLRKDNKIYEKDFKKNTMKPMTFNGVKSIINLSIFQPAVSRDSKIIELLGYIPFDTKYSNLGEKIIVFRRIHGLSQKKLALLIGIDSTTIGSLERNKHKPSKELLEKLLSFFTSYPISLN